jgi:hypothetical protein
MVEQLFATADKRQQRQMPGALDFTRQFTLAARAVARLTARLDFARFSHIAAQGINIFIVEALAFRAVSCLTTTPPTTTAIIAAIALITITIVTVTAIPPETTTIFSIHCSFFL